MKLKRLLALLQVIIALTVSLNVFAQQVTVKGKITDSKTSLPLAGATIKVKNGNASAITDVNGVFSIKAPSSESILSITYVGYRVFEIKAGDGNLSIAMESLGTDLNEVVIVGYGTQKKTHLTGSVATVEMKSIADLPAGNLSEALKGQIVGVGVSGGFSRPGEPATINIRAPIFFSKDGGSKEPLYVIDDIIRTKTDFDLLDATEVESISVLKDAAAAIYGILGSNGAIIVKTKRGRSGQATISYSASFGISGAPVMPKMMNAYQQSQYINAYLGGTKNWDSASTVALATYYTPDEQDYFKTHSYNWLSEAFQQSYEMRHTLNISGGSEKATYFAGMSYIDQNSNFPGLGYKRYSFRASTDIKLTTGLKLGLSLSSNLSDKNNTFNKQGSESLENDWKTLITSSPMYPAYINGLPIYIPNTGTSASINNYHYFAVHDLNNYTRSLGNSTNFQASLSYEFPYLKGLKASVNYNKNIANNWGKQYGTKYNVYQFNTLGAHNHLLDTSYNKVYTWSNGDRIRLNPSIANSYQVNALLNYDKQIGQHQFNVLVGYEQSEASSDGIAGMVDGVLVGGLDNQNFATGTQSSNETSSESGRMAFFGRLDYNYANKYILQMQFRGDASQNFAPESRWGYFPSGSFGWVVSEEKFFRRIADKINYLKLRASVGFMGIDNTKPYQWLRSYALQTGKAAVYGGNTDRGNAVVTNVELANRDVHWDSQNKYNVGVDAKFLNSRLSAALDGYINKSYNMLSSLTAAPSILIGATLPSENFGKANVFGYEASVSWKDRIGKNWGYNITANFSWNDNKVLVADVAKLDKGTFKDQNGKSTDMGFFGYQCLGMFRSQSEVDSWLNRFPGYTLFGQVPKPGMLYYLDVRGAQNTTTGVYDKPDGKIDANDQTYLKKHAENHYGLGFNWGVSYKTISLNVVMGMSWGGIGSVESAARKLGNNTYQNRPAFWTDAWTPTNTDAKYPAPIIGNYVSYDYATDFWWRSSFSLRVTNFNLSYNLPQSAMKKIGFNSGRIYLVGTNPLNLFNPYDYKDNANGSFDVFPQLRTFTLGLNVNL